MHDWFHTRSKPFKCVTCKKTFFQACHLRTHELTYSGFAYQKIFSRASNLDKQEITHTTVKDFKCITCPKTIPKSSYLRRNELIHTGLKEYKCITCQKTFFRAHDLRNH